MTVPPDESRIIGNPNKILNQRFIPLKIVLIYLLVAVLWLLCSGRIIAALAPEWATLLNAHIVQDGLRVALTCTALYGLTSYYLTALQRAYHAVETSARRYYALIEHMNEGVALFDVIFDADMRPVDVRVLDVNPTFADIVGIPREQLFGTSGRRSLLRDNILHLPLYARVAQTGESTMYETHLATVQRDLLVSVFSPAYGQCAIVATDISARRRQEERERDFLHRTIEEATEGKLIICAREEIMAMAGPAIAVWQIAACQDFAHIRNAVGDKARADGMSEERIFDFLLCISEAITNACTHANGGTLSLHQGPQALLAIVADQGPGIPAMHLPQLALRRGFTTGGTLGMGYKTMIAVADTVFLDTGPHGTTVGIDMGLQPPEPPPVIAVPTDKW